jgi:hypothetical protein
MYHVKMQLIILMHCNLLAAKSMCSVSSLLIRLRALLNGMAFGSVTGVSRPFIYTWQVCILFYAGLSKWEWFLPYAYVVRSVLQTQLKFHFCHPINL